MRTSHTDELESSLDRQSPLVKRRSSLRSLRRFSDSSDETTPLSRSKGTHTVLSSEKIGKQKLYVIKWALPLLPLMKTPPIFEDIRKLYPNDTLYLFAAAHNIDNIENIEKDRVLNAALTTETYTTLQVSLDEFDNALSTQKIPWSIKLRHGCLSYLSAFLKRNGHALTIEQHAALYHRYQQYLDAEAFERGGNYLRQEIQARRDKHLQMLTLESSTSALYQFVGGDHFSPKTRVLFDESNETAHPIGLASHRIHDFSPANTVDMATLQDIASNNPREYAKLFVSIFAFAENDLHGGNWGVNLTRQTLVKIDHDNSFYPYFEKRAPKNKMILNSFYDANDALTFISSWDIRHLPKVHDSKPYHSPVFLHSTAQPLEFLETLNQHAAFNDWKYFYFVKVLLLSTEVIDTIVDDNSIGNTALDTALKKTIHDRLSALKETLLHTPEFIDFVCTKIDKIPFYSALESELTSYNAHSCGRSDNGSPKLHKAHRFIDIDKVYAAVCELKTEAQDKATTFSRDPRILFSFQIAELMKRIDREMSLHKSASNFANDAHRIPSILQTSLNRDFSFLVAIKSSLTTLIPMLATAFNSLKDAQTKTLCCNALFQALTAQYGVMHAIDMLSDYFPSILDKSILSFLQTIEDVGMVYPALLLKIKERKPYLLPEVCNTIMHRICRMNGTLYEEIIDIKNQASFEAFSQSNKNNLIAKIFSAKNTLQRILDKCRPQAAFAFAQTTPVIDNALKKCLSLLMTQSVVFLPEEVQVLKHWISAPSTDERLKDALVLLLNDTFDTETGNNPIQVEIVFALDAMQTLSTCSKPLPKKAKVKTWC